MQKITLLAIIAAGVFAADQPELAAGTTLMAPPEVADALIADGRAQLAGDDVQLSELPEAVALPGTTDPANTGAADTTVTDLAPSANTVKTPKAAKTVQVRLLTDGIYGSANDVVTLPAGIVKQLTAASQADSDESAVTYALGLPQNQPKA